MIASLLVVANLLCLQAQPVDRALWMWHGQPVITDKAARSSFFNFIKAPKGDPDHRISVIFLGEVDPSDPAASSPIGDLLEQCHSLGVRVDFLCGEATFAEPDHNADGVRFVAQVLAYNASAPAKRRFDGFQFDVEPYALSGWPSPALHSGFLRLYEQSKELIKQAGSSMLLGAAIPRWFDAPELGGLYKEIIDRTDYVAVMDYVSTSKDFVKDPAKTVEYANRAGKQAWLGAEATRLPTEPMATFFEKGNAAMEAAFAAAQQAYGVNRGFAGVAVEYYETYRALRP
jgi:hypothetical protein